MIYARDAATGGVQRDPSATRTIISTLSLKDAMLCIPRQIFAKRDLRPWSTKHTCPATKYDKGLGWPRGKTTVAPWHSRRLKPASPYAPPPFLSQETIIHQGTPPGVYTPLVNLSSPSRYAGLDRGQHTPSTLRCDLAWPPPLPSGQIESLRSGSLQWRPSGPRRRL